MVMNNAVRGAINPDLLPFSLYEMRAGTLVEYDKMLGMGFRLPGGLEAILVEAAGTITTPSTGIGGLCLKWANTLLKTVVITSGAGDEPCGFTLPGLEEVESGEFFFMVVPTRAGATVSLVDAGAGSAAGAYLQATAAGEVVTDAAFDHANPGTSFCRIIDTAAADAECQVELILGQVGGLTV